MTHNTREGQPTESQALPHENIIQKCWKPDCRKVATCRDGSGWEWCDGHVDQEKTGSVLHTAQEYYDVDYYTALLKERIHHQLQKARQNWLRSEIEKLETVENELAKLQGWLGTVAGSQTDSTISQKPSKDVQDAKALHTSIIMTAKDKIKPIQTTLATIITRYKEELKVLESK